MLVKKQILLKRIIFHSLSIAQVRVCEVVIFRPLPHTCKQVLRKYQNHYSSHLQTASKNYRYQYKFSPHLQTERRMPSSSWTSDNRLWKLDILFWTTVPRNVLFGLGNKPMSPASIVGLQIFQFWIHYLHHLCQLHVIPVQLRCFGTTECFVSKKTLEFDC